MRASVERARDVDALKEAVRSGLAAVETHVGEHLRVEGQRHAEAEDEARATSERLVRLVAETGRLRERLHRARQRAVRDPLTGLYNRLASWMTGHKVEDLTSGFRAVRADRFREFLYLLPNGFSYPTTSTMAFFRAGYSVAYVPIHAARRIGTSHIRLLRDGARFFLIIFKIGTLFSPVKIFAPVALGMFLLATGWYGWTWWHQGRFTNMSTLLYTGSVMVFLMGLISEQITALMYKDSA